jgi:hypothetical protein
MNRIDEQGNEWVTIQNPGITGTAEVTRQAFEEVYQEKGWELVNGDVVVPTGEVPADAGVMVAPQPATPAEPAPADNKKER